jgi:hypothetical protein
MKDGISVVEICNKNKLDANSLDILIEKNKIKTPNNIEIYQKLLEVEKKLNVLLFSKLLYVLYYFLYFKSYVL